MIGFLKVLGGAEYGHVIGHQLADDFPHRATARAGCVTGQHTDGILTEPGWSAERIAGLRERKVAG